MERLEIDHTYTAGGLNWASDVWTILVDFFTFWQEVLPTWSSLCSILTSVKTTNDINYKTLCSEFWKFIRTYNAPLACNGDFNDFIPSNLPRQTRTVVTQRQILRMSNGFTNFIRHVTISQSASNIHILTCIKCFCRTYFIVRGTDLFSRFFENRSPLAPISIVISWRLPPTCHDELEKKKP